MIFALERLTGRVAAMFYLAGWVRLANPISKVSWRLYDLHVFGIGARAALAELRATLADVARCGDLAGHLVAWWDVVTGETHADDREFYL
jgi:hypothetical protein